jgi:hypothetical protein
LFIIIILILREEGGTSERSLGKSEDAATPALAVGSVASSVGGLASPDAASAQPLSPMQLRSRALVARLKLQQGHSSVSFSSSSLR